MMENSNTLHSGMCRCCSSEGTFKDIKTKYHWMGEEEIYADMLTDCFDIKISTPEDNLDNGICEVCITQLRNAANFKKQVLHTEEQFKRRLENRDIKNPIKLESIDDPIESDHLSDPDFSGPEYDVPIKMELDIKPKTRKRQAKPATTRAKKAKEGETSTQRVQRSTRIITIDASRQRASLNLASSPNVLRLSSVGSVATKKNHHNLDDHHYTSALNTGPSNTKPTVIPKKRYKGTQRNVKESQMGKHLQNLETILLYSNATPTRGHRGLGYECFYCSVMYNEADDLKSHTLEMHEDRKYEGPSPYSPSLDCYSVKLDITNLTCRLCFKVFTQLADLMTHLRIDHEKLIHIVPNHILPFRFDGHKIKCGICDAENNTFRMAQEHMNIHYRNYICDICDAGFMNRAPLRIHKNNHKYGDYPCPKCPQTLNTRAKLAYHISYFHEGKDKRVKCAYCDERFVSVIARNNHLVKDHEAVRKIAQCKACDRVFQSNQNLRSHYKAYHLQIKKFKCKYCEKDFASRNYLENHIVKHTGAKNFKCDLCGKAYGRKCSLIDHVRKHLGDTRHKCEYCPKAFVHSASFRAHMKSKHAEEINNMNSIETVTETE